MNDKLCDQDTEHDFEFADDCGVSVCTDCGWHRGLIRCYCGWSVSGRDGRDELREWGENIQEDY
jgi:hypothetical protein